jgi:hypothetical protein
MTFIFLALGIAIRPIVAQQQAPVRVASSVLERYVGEYSIPNGRTVLIRLQGDTLIQQVERRSIILVPISETRFLLSAVFTVEFVIDQAGDVTMITGNGIEQELRIPRKGSRVAPPPPPPVAVRVPRSVLERYVGTYEYIPGQMSRIDLRIIVRLRGDTLIRQMGREVVLTPISDTRFRVGDTSLIAEFVVDEAGVTHVMGSGFQQQLARRTTP